jgi:glycerophosphoryl diester phosphodiesterase
MSTAFRTPERVAHRGAPRERTENTLEGFLLALERGADAIELDVHASLDDEILVHHDFEVQRLNIESTARGLIERVELPGGGRVPRLSEVLREIGDRATVYVELKGRDLEDRVVPVLREFGHRFAVHSFDHDAIVRCGEEYPEIPRGVLLDRDVPQPIERLREAVERAEPRDVWPHYSLVNERFMDAAGELGVRVIPWTVNDRADAARLAALGVAGLCSDDVRLLANL